MNTTTSELAEILTISRRRLDELSAAGIIPKESRNSYNIKESVKAFISYREEEIRAELPTSNGDADERFREARASLYQERCREQKRRSDLIEGSSHAAASIVAVMGGALSATRARILSLPNANAAALAETSDPEACRKLLHDACKEALTDLSEYDSAAVVQHYRQEAGTPMPTDHSEKL